MRIVWIVLFATAVFLGMGKLTTAPAGAQSDDDADALRKVVNELVLAGKFLEALPFAERYAEAMKAKHGSDRSEYAGALSIVAQMLEGAKRIGEAEPLYRRALTIYEKGSQPDDLGVAWVLSGLARALRDTNRHREAEPLLRRALAIHEKNSGPDSLLVASALTDLAELLRDTNRHSEAEPLYRRALAIEEKRIGHINYWMVALTLRKLAGLLRDMNRLGEAEPLYRRALAINENSSGPEDPSVAATLNDLALLLQDMNRHGEAEPLLRRALAIEEKKFGPDDPRIATVLNNLAVLMQNMNRFREAETLYRRAIAVSEHTGAIERASSLNLSVLYQNAGGFFKSQGSRSEARSLLEKALAIREQVFGANDPRLAYSLTQLGDLYRMEGQCTRAEPLFLRARAVGSATIREVPIVFGTDRKRDLKQPSVAFGGERDRAMSFGLVIVTVPIGEAREEEARLIALLNDIPPATTQARRLAMHCIEVVGQEKVVDAAAGRIRTAKQHSSQALVFVHGYNVSFEDALRRAAQIAYDIAFDGGVFVFSWPARGGWSSYLGDRNTVDLAQVHLKEFLDGVVAGTGADRVHFIAHSMGNMVLLHALDRIVATESRYAIGEIVSAAPDVDRDLFESLTKSIRSKGARFTLYAARSDWALRFSQWLWGQTRAGYIDRSTPLIVPGVDTIDITAAGTNWFAWNHDLYASSPILVEDMRRIIKAGERPPPDKRTQAFERVDTKAGTYWRLRTP